MKNDHPKFTLAMFSDDELIEELARRSNNRDARDIEANDVGRWCHDCGNFNTWKRPGEPPESFNPCGKRHTMSLYLPKDHESPEVGGFFRRVCADRKEKI